MTPRMGRDVAGFMESAWYHIFTALYTRRNRRYICADGNARKVATLGEAMGKKGSDLVGGVTMGRAKRAFFFLRQRWDRRLGVTQ